ncbi:cyanophycinase [Gloeobacter kilaueensis]|uniref:Cyanophycinase n=1 Tax=Gloeobacter kilaueensis (strain ATCC BAA-2537 / CCAP 1431/1 / ULC 316 / JS1) TaxID=1183438 RepID=U5QIF5_GLOK1|nr:cyanophycinase [Gloeobacter kilaueensis]AGY57435.1 cyanophycinase [Gloeobacter kilaueensis JS1]
MVKIVINRALSWLWLPLMLVWVQAAAAGVIVAAGGGAEGDVGDTGSWSYRLYRKLVQNGDVTGDGRIKVVILSTADEDSFLPDYFVWLGASSATNVKVASLADANNAAIVAPLQDADVVFIKGGDQGVYYDAWNGTLLESSIRTVVVTRGGAIGGTSAGAMSLPQYSFAGGQDLISLDVLTDAKTPYLNDASDGGSGIHTDFLGFVANALIDTHFTKRGRLGRLLGLLGKAVQDNNATGILAIGIEEQTGIAVTGTSAEVVGTGSVDFIQQTGSTVLRRDSGRPLYYTHLRLDRLTEGWQFDLSSKLPNLSTRPATAVAVSYPGDGSANSGALTIQGDYPSDAQQFAHTVLYAPDAYSAPTGSASPYIKSSLGLIDAQNTDSRGAIQQSIFRALYDYPSYTGFLVAFSGQLERTSTSPDNLQFKRNTAQSGSEAATIVLDGKALTYKDLSPYVSLEDSGSGTLKAAAFVNLAVDVLAESNATSRGATYNTRTHSVVGGP